MVKAITPEQKAIVGRQTPGQVLITLHTDNIDEEYKRMKANGVTFHSEPANIPWGKAAEFVDLYGNQYYLLEWNKWDGSTKESS